MTTPSDNAHLTKTSGVDATVSSSDATDTKKSEDSVGVQKLDAKKALFQGVTFTFHVNGSVIECWGSGWSGKEVIKVDGKLISQRRVFLSNPSVHSFIHNGVTFEVEFNIINRLTGELHCILIRDGVHVETKKLLQTHGKNENVYDEKAAKRNVIVGAVFGFILGFFVMFILLNDESIPLLKSALEFMASWF